jgi:hypothetical protein
VNAIGTQTESIFVTNVVAGVIEYSNASLQFVRAAVNKAMLEATANQKLGLINPTNKKQLVNG